MEVKDPEWYSNMVDIAVDKLVEQVDWDIMCEILKGSGWIKITLKNKTAIQLKEAQNWAYSQGVRKVKNKYADFMFPSEIEAMAFLLKWD